ncbi:hypothetical protein D3C75_928960 [compost metagenome]
MRQRPAHTLQIPLAIAGRIAEKVAEVRQALKERLVEEVGNERSEDVRCDLGSILVFVVGSGKVCGYRHEGGERIEAVVGVVIPVHSDAVGAPACGLLGGKFLLVHGATRASHIARYGQCTDGRHEGRTYQRTAYGTLLDGTACLHVMPEGSRRQGGWPTVPSHFNYIRWRSNERSYYVKKW